jgi:hypothetical protein
METKRLSPELYNKMLDTIREIKVKLIDVDKHQDKVLDNAEFLLFMKISRNTAQRWRDKGLIKFSKVGNKYYYKVSDIKEMFEKHYVSSFKK